MKSTLLILLLIYLLLKPVLSAQGLIGISNKYAGIDYPTAESEAEKNRLINGYKHSDSHSQAAADWLYELNDFYFATHAYNEEAQTLKLYIKVYDDPRWKPLVGLRRQVAGYSMMGLAYSCDKNNQAAEQAYITAFKIAKSKFKTDSSEEELDLVDIFYELFGFYIEIKQPYKALALYKECLPFNLKHYNKDLPEKRAQLIKLGINKNLIPLK